MWTSLLGLSLAMLTVSATGPTPDPNVESALTVMLAPCNVFGETRLSGVVMKNPRHPSEEAFLPVPGSVLPAWGRVFEYTANPLKSHEDADVIDASGSGDPFSTLRVGTLHRVHWPPEVPVDKNVKHFTPDGRPPY
jgi:hypothetical protein